MKKYYTVGKIVNTHGLDGEVRVITISDFKEERYRVGNTLYYFADDHPNENLDADVDVKQLTIAAHREHNQFDLLRFEGHHSIDAVEPYKGGWLKVAADQRDTLPEGEYYFDEIIGCQVESESGDKLGIVHSILTPGANDVWVVKAEGRSKELLIPYIDDVVKEVNIDQKRIVIHLLEGLLDE